MAKFHGINSLIVDFSQKIVLMKINRLESKNNAQIFATKAQRLEDSQRGSALFITIRPAIQVSIEAME